MGFADKAATVVVLGIALALAGVSAKVAYSVAENKYLKEMAAIQAANDKAIASAEKVLREDVAIATLENQRLQDELEKLIQAADADPDADACGMSVDGVRRHNALK